MPEPSFPLLNVKAMPWSAVPLPHNGDPANEVTLERSLRALTVRTDSLRDFVSAVEKRALSLLLTTGNAGGVVTYLSGTRAQRRNLPQPSTVTEYREIDTRLALTYYPGVGWRDAYGGDPDAAPPPPDTGVY